MKGTSKTVRSVHAEQTYDHTVATERTYVHSVATVKTHVCAVTMTWTYYVFMATQFNTLKMQLSRDLLLLDILIFVKIIRK